MSGKRKLAETQDDQKDAEKAEVAEVSSSVKKQRMGKEGPLPELEDRDSKRTQKEPRQVGYRIAMELLQQLQHGQDCVLSQDIVSSMEEIISHTQTFVAFARRHTPTPFPPTLGLFCIFSSEVLLYLFTYLSPRELWAARAVCRVFEGISRDQTLWKTLCQRHFSPIHNQLHLKLGKNWEWLYRCKARQFRTKSEVSEGAIGSFVDQSQGMNERYEGEWIVSVARSSFFRNSGKAICELNGYGMFINEGNNIFEGNFKLGKLHGPGRQCANVVNFEFEYTGEFKDGLWSGPGQCIYVDGRKYDGYWEQGMRHGLGTMLFPDGRKFVGEWRKDERNGKGVLYWPSGAVYEGFWKGDEMKGGGKFTSNDGTDSFSPSTLEEAFTILWKKTIPSSLAVSVVTNSCSRWTAPSNSVAPEERNGMVKEDLPHDVPRAMASIPAASKPVVNDDEKAPSRETKGYKDGGGRSSSRESRDRNKEKTDRHQQKSHQRVEANMRDSSHARK